MKSLLAVTAAAVSLFAALPASATTYIADFSPSSSTSGAFTFGSFSGGTFTAFPTGGTCLFASTVCLTSGNYLGVYKSSDGASHVSGTGLISASGLLLHPGQNGELATILFTAPTAGTYSITASAYQADTSPQSQTVGYILGGTPFTFATLTTGAPTASGNGSVFLAQGQTLGIFVGNNGSYYNDLTGINFSLSVPEPATWAMMLLGFGMVGVGLRNRKRAPKVTYA